MLVFSSGLAGETKEAKSHVRCCARCVFASHLGVLKYCARSLLETGIRSFAHFLDDCAAGSANANWLILFSGRLWLDAFKWGRGVKRTNN